MRATTRRPRGLMSGTFCTADRAVLQPHYSGKGWGAAPPRRPGNRRPSRWPGAKRWHIDCYPLGDMASFSTLRRILLVEDDEDTRQLLAVALEAQAYEVSQAGDAEGGLEALRAGHFDMILTDYDLPGKTGAAMLREASARRLVDGAATLVVTAHPDPEGGEETTLVRKPLDLEKFLHQVRRIFDSMPVAAGPVGSSPADKLAPAERAEAVDPVELTLYISPTSPPSLKARRNMEKLLQDFRAAEIGFEVLDLA